MPNLSNLDASYVAAARAVGFTDEQIVFMEETFAFDPHTHTADQIFVDSDETETLDTVLEDAND
jgi:hypothetical protein